MPVEPTQLFALGSERDALTMNLDAQREGLIRKVEGVPDALARRAPTASPLSLLGLVKHAATWEQRWFEGVVAGRELADGWPDVRPEPRDRDLRVEEGDTLEHWVAAYRAQIEVSHEVVASRDLDDPCARQDLIACNLRHVLFHLIQETARHTGHADIIRETLDGVTGI